MARKKNNRRKPAANGGGDGKADPQKTGNGKSRAPKTGKGKAGNGTASLKLVRIDPRGAGLHFVFEDGGAERRWKLEAASAREFLALLLKGEMRSGRRVMTKEAEASIEAPEKRQGAPVLCVSLGHVEICLALDRAELGALGRDIERALKS